MDNTTSIEYQRLANGVNTLYKIEVKVNRTAALETTERNEVTATGAPSYTSAVQRWKGTADILKAKPETNNIKANVCIGVLLKWAVNILKLRVPEVPYKKEIPINKMPEENAEDKINFIAASEDFLLAKLKLAAAASGMVDISTPK